MKASLNEDEIDIINDIVEGIEGANSKKAVIIEFCGGPSYTVKNIKTLKAKETMIEVDGHFFEIINIAQIVFWNKIINCT